MKAAPSPGQSGGGSLPTRKWTRLEDWLGEQERLDLEGIDGAQPATTVELPMETVAQARTSDPPESHEAAASVNTTRGQMMVADFIVSRWGYHGQFTLEQLVDAATEAKLQLSPSGIRSRCKELFKEGFVIRQGQAKTASNRNARLHRLVRHPRSEPQSIGAALDAWKERTT